MAQAVPVNVPTWTGRHGEGGLQPPAEPRRFGNIANPALRSLGNAPWASYSASFSGATAGTSGGVAPRSADLLAKLQQRQQAAVIAGSSNSTSGEDPTSLEVNDALFGCAF